MTTPELDYLTAQVEKLKPDEQLLLIERIVALLRNSTLAQEEATHAEAETWDIDELQALLNDNHPITTQEIVAQGFFGGWEDLDITDSLTWVEQQRAKTRGRYE
jgi:hypothetical protein